MSNSYDLRWSARLDRRLIGTRGGKRHILVDVSAPKKHDAERKRAPLNLALVIDASGSMSGEPLDAARQAARGVVEQLTSADRITLVSFADDVIVHVDAAAADDDGRRLAFRAIDGMTTRGCTNLAGGWLEGCDCVANEMERRARAGVGNGDGGENLVAQNRVIVLSDGHANRGLQDPEELALRAAGLRQRGLYTSAVGIGDHYSPTQLEAIAEHGGGRLHDAPLGEDIVAVVLGELGEIREAAADDVTLTVRHPRVMGVTALGRYPVTHGDGEVRVVLGPLTTGAQRSLVLQVAAPRGRAGDALAIDLLPSWCDPESGERTCAEPLTVTLSLVPEIEVQAETIDRPTCERIATLWHNHLLLESTLLNSESRFEDAERLVREALPDFREYCRGLAGVAHLVNELDHQGRRVSVQMCDAGVRDDVFAAKMMLKGQRDFRVNRGRGPRV